MQPILANPLKQKLLVGDLGSLDLWPYMAIFLGMAKGNACHIYFNKEQGSILDAIGAAMGKRRLGIDASRSQLICSAVRNFIEDCMAEEDLREAITEARKRLAAQKESPHAT